MSTHGHPGSNMSPTSWRALTSSRLTSFKDYVAQLDYKAKYDSLSSRVRGTKDDGSRQTWDQWARQALRKPYSSIDLQRTSLAVETLHLFPGWAVRRYKDPTRVNESYSEFGLDVYVSGFASNVRPLEAATRSQKAFYRLAKGYAALPKLRAVSAIPGTQEMGLASSQIFGQPSETELPKSSPNPTDHIELETLEAQFREVSQSFSSASSSFESSDEEDVSCQNRGHHSKLLQEEDADQYMNSTSVSNHTKRFIPSRSDPSLPISSPTRTPLSPSCSLQAELVDSTIQRLHANLDSRLQPFWSNAIPNRIIRLSIFCPGSAPPPSEVHDTMEGRDADFEPLATQYVTTNSQGAFQATFTVPWDRLATHPPTLHVAFGDRDTEYPVIVQAEMWAPPPYSSSASPAFAVPPPSSASPDLGSPIVKNRITVSLSMPHVPVRLISDIDDTIKHAGVLQGAKHVFQNVFVRHLEDLVVPGMVDWYRTLWQRGVRFHYVSNSPFELLPVLNEYFHVSSLPEGSIRLKSYAARSLLPALLSSPASRKRQGVVEVLDAFPESQFILVGDTGEQDMELYAELARERPHQVAGVFVRNVTTRSRQVYGAEGNDIFNTQSGRPLMDTEPEAMGSMHSLDSLSSSSSGLNYGTSPNRSSPALSPVTPMPKSPRPFLRSRSWGTMTVEEKREYELEGRIRHARAEIPMHIAFRVFQEPQECVEMPAILDRYLGCK